MDKKLINTIEKYISSVSENQPGFLKAFLFGSYAKNNYETESDIDIALVIDNLNDLEKFNVQVNLMLLAAQIDTRIEPHPISMQDFMSENNPFGTEIRKTGIEFHLS
ncbi:nucleotidyltransferase domain-containing protein [Dyadobacter sp. CY356]|uniref:nucleotidyltransferase domain-containing protein n=1 Tax=Dyadobacter sp. CY356 TaxID=2906442 RepID=UPI001F26F438|nr:nucleotidyltransferase domain-containing protein [Dyadobacter sp. CY356]MCF0059719.1 nucleotidyltransferase domain-containing protein [Dyadobacter sp. CY356]